MASRSPGKGPEQARQRDIRHRNEHAGREPRCGTLLGWRDADSRILGKIKKRVWIREGDVVIVVPWEFQNEKADVVWRYTGPQVDGWKEKASCDTITLITS